MTGRPSQSITTDAAHSTKNGRTQYRAIELATGKELFYQDIGNQTVNIGEFLGVVEAAKYIIENDYQSKVIYTDSVTAITWFNNKQTASKKNYTPLKKAVLFLKAMAQEVDKIKVLHWKNDLWGETPADFGNK